MRKPIGLLLLMCILPCAGWAQIYVQSDAQNARSLAVVVEDSALVHTTQIFAQNPSLLLDRLEEVLELAGTDLRSVVKWNVYLADSVDLAAVKQEIRKRLDTTRLPALMVVQTSLPENSRLAMDAIAICNQQATKSERRLGGDQFAVLPLGGATYVSGQAEKGADLSEATARTMESLTRSLTHVGLGWQDVVQIKCFLHPMDQFDLARQAIQRHLATQIDIPLVFVEWQGSSLPIEIELVAATRSSDTPTIAFLTPPGMSASPVYSRIVQIRGGRRVYTSGLAVIGSGEQQVAGVFNQLQSLLDSTQTDMQHLAKATYYVSNDEVSQALNRMRPTYYLPQSPPAASKATVTSTVFSGTDLIADWIAVGK